MTATGTSEAARDIRDATLVKEGDLFMLADLRGNVPAGNVDGLGLYYRDTRFLSTYDLGVQGLEPTILLSSGRWHFLGTYVLTNPSLVTEEGGVVDKETIQIRRYRLARSRHLSDSLAFENLNAFPVKLEVALRIGADFADMFEVRGFVGASARVVVREISAASLSFRCEGCDGIRRVTRVRFDPPPNGIVEGVACYRLELPARGSQRVAVEIDVEEEPREPAAADLAPTPAPAGAPARPPALPGAARRRDADTGATVRTSNGLFELVLAQARADVRALWSGEGEGAYIAAGIPWYAALFGRDSLIAALADLWISPAPATCALRLLARMQGRRDDARRDEEPGKILHENRVGELARADMVPFGPYFGTVDATPLWIILLAELYRRVGDLALVRALAPNLDLALAWIDRYGDLDGDGFVEYRSRAPLGLVNQGWKDSWDGIVHADGSLPEPPIALVEVQAYVYAAKRGAAALFRALGDPGRASALDADAARLREAFDAAFWMPSEGTYCLALDGKKRQVAAVASNAGHALLSGIVPPERAAKVAARLMAEDLFSGWGVRTLSNREVRYSPIGYHIGTVWPHDNALIALGLKRCGLEGAVVEIATGLFDAAAHFPQGRMPELFCGYARSAFGVPVRYPVACSPQAWAATSWSMLLQAMLGLLPDATARKLSIVRPTLPPWLDWVEVDRIAVGAGEVDVRYERIGARTAVDVVAMRGDVRVTFVSRWPDGDAARLDGTAV